MPHRKNTEQLRAETRRRVEEEAKAYRGIVLSDETNVMVRLMRS